MGKSEGQAVRDALEIAQAIMITPTKYPTNTVLLFTEQGQWILARADVVGRLLVSGIITAIDDDPLRELGKVGLSLAVAYQFTPITRDGNGRITQIILTDGVFVKTIDVPRDADGRIEEILQAVV